MLANYTPRNFTFTVDGKDCTNLLVDASGGYSQLNTSGLLLLQAEYELGLTADFDESFDDRINTRWSLAKEIKHTVLGTDFPIIGTTYIESSEWNRLQTLRIKAAGLLSLYNYVSPADLGVCVELDAEMSHGVAIATLLTKAGIPLDRIRIGNIPGFLVTPLALTGGQSFISLAGQIAFSSGRFLYQDNTGFIRSLVFVDTNHGLSFTEAEARLKRYERLYDPELPPKTVIVSGATTTLEDNLDRLDKTYTNVRQVDVAPGDNQIIFGTTTEKTTNKVTYTSETREVRKETKVSSPLGYVAPAFHPGRISKITANREITIEKYELPPSPADATPLTANVGNVPNEVSTKPVEECIPSDAGRIYQRRTTHRAPRLVPLEDYMKIREAEEPGDGIIGSTASGTWKIVTENWAYNFNQLNDETIENATFNFNEVSSNLIEQFGSTPDTTGANTIQKITYDRTVRVWIGKVFPLLAAFPWGKAEGGLPQPQQYVTEESEQVVWAETAKNSNVWSKTRNVYRNRYLESPELVNEMIADSGTLATSVVSAASATRQVVGEIESNATPPSPGVFPAVIRERNEPYKVLVRMESSLFDIVYDKSLTLNLGNYPVNKTFAATIGGEWGRVLWERSKGQLITTPLEFIPSNIRPLHRVDVQEIDQTTASYAVDGPQVAVSRISDFGTFEAAFSFTGLYKGKTTTTDPLLTPVPIIITESPAIQGDPVGVVIITASVNDQFLVQIGPAQVPLTLTAGTYNNAQELVDEINTQLAGSMFVGADQLQAELSDSGDSIVITTPLTGSTVTIQTGVNPDLGFGSAQADTGQDAGNPDSEYQVNEPAPNPPAEPALQFSSCSWTFYTSLIAATDEDIDPEITLWQFECTIIEIEFIEILDICTDGFISTKTGETIPADIPFATELYPSDSRFSKIPPNDPLRAVYMNGYELPPGTP